MKTVAAALVLYLLLVSIGCDKGKGSVGIGIAQPRYKEVIRKHLRENTASGKFEEINWSDHFTQTSGDEVVRLKYRVLDPTPHVEDQYFTIDLDGKIITSPSGLGKPETEEEMITIWEGIIKNPPQPGDREFAEQAIVGLKKHMARQK